jgi:DNA-binding transcriptional LysR family regulator
VARSPINKHDLLSGNNGALSPTHRSSRTLARVLPDAGFELRHLRTFVTVAKYGNFTRAAEDLHIAQQAVSQQIRSLEGGLGVTLLSRSSRMVTLTAEGTVFLADANRVLSAAHRARRRVDAAARGELGSLRLAYTLTTAWETLPVLVADLAESLPHLKVDAREVFGGDIDDLLASGRHDLALAPTTAYAGDTQQRAIRRESLRVALAQDHPLARRNTLELATLSDQQFEIWPRDMAPGFYDTVVGVCRAAGFEPSLDERGTGNTVWGYIAEGRGVGLINSSLIRQLPRGITLVDLAHPQPIITIDAVWLRHDASPAIARAIEAVEQHAASHNWL